MYDFVAIDFETANNKLNSACSVGLVAVKGREIVKQDYFFITPPTPNFDPPNIDIHGITYDMVKEAGTFAENWDRIKSMLENTYFVVAHNAQFDMSVLKCCMDEYNLQIPDFLFIDNISILHNSPYYVENNSLQAAAEACGVDMGIHHNALDDALTVTKIILELMEDQDFKNFLWLTTFFQPKAKKFSELKPIKTFSSLAKPKFTDTTISLQELKNIAEKIISDCIVEKNEILFIDTWVENHPELKGNFPYDKISELCRAILEDGIVSENEKAEMLHLLKEFVNPMERSCEKCAIDFEGKLFVLSGDFKFGSKKDVETKIAEKGGICNSRITKNTDYLIVGDAGSDNWKFGNYGAKVSKALEMQESGHHIVILKESDLTGCF